MIYIFQAKHDIIQEIIKEDINQEMVEAFHHVNGQDYQPLKDLRKNLL
jgi:hypothetical protein